MAIQAGLVGLPNVGKSTLFNALTKAGIPAANYPFCTVDPHVAITEVPDERLDKLATIFNSQKKIPTTVQFVDIAGLVKGAAQGEGLGNQFLSNIFGVDLILHVVRCFEDSNITHVHNDIDPLDDFETICAELMLKDLESIEKKEEKFPALFKKAKSKQASAQEIKDLENEQKLVGELKELLEKGNLNDVFAHIVKARKDGVETIPLLSDKKYLIIANVSEDDLSSDNYKNNEHYQKLVERFGENRVIAISAKIESELAQLDEEEAAEMLESLDITSRGLDDIIKKSYAELGLITFFTCGPKEAHAWSIPQGINVREAAGEIHSDLQRGFICAEVYNCEDLFAAGSEQELKNSGKLRTEGKDYIVNDGDLLNIRFNV